MINFQPYLFLKKCLGSLHDYWVKTELVFQAHSLLYFHFVPSTFSCTEKCRRNKKCIDPFFDIHKQCLISLSPLIALFHNCDSICFLIDVLIQEKGRFILIHSDYWHKIEKNILRFLYCNLLRRKKRSSHLPLLTEINSKLR